MTHEPATILIVDDEPLNLKLLQALLDPEGYRVVCAATGEEALAIVASSAPNLILLDVRMPGMDGYHVVSILKAEPTTAQIPVIMVTAQDDRASRVVGLDAGAEDFLSKPVDRMELTLKIRNLLRLRPSIDYIERDTST